MTGNIRFDDPEFDNMPTSEFDNPVLAPLPGGSFAERLKQARRQQHPRMVLVGAGLLGMGLTFWLLTALVGGHGPATANPGTSEATSPVTTAGQMSGQGVVATVRSLTAPTAAVTFVNAAPLVNPAAPVPSGVIAVVLPTVGAATEAACEPQPVGDPIRAGEVVATHAAPAPGGVKIVGTYLYVVAGCWTTIYYPVFDVVIADGLPVAAGWVLGQSGAGDFTYEIWQCSGSRLLADSGTVARDCGREPVVRVQQR